MFKITGTKDQHEITVTWDEGVINPAEARAAVIKRLVSLAERGIQQVESLVHLQTCTASMGDPLFCATTLIRWLDPDAKYTIEGDWGAESVQGRIY